MPKFPFVFEMDHMNGSCHVLRCRVLLVWLRDSVINITVQTENGTSPSERVCLSGEAHLTEEGSLLFNQLNDEDIQEGAHVILGELLRLGRTSSGVLNLPTTLGKISRDVRHIA